MHQLQDLAETAVAEMAAVVVDKPAVQIEVAVAAELDQPTLLRLAVLV